MSRQHWHFEGRKTTATGVEYYQWKRCSFEQPDRDVYWMVYNQAVDDFWAVP